MKRHWTLALIAAFALVAIGGWFAWTRAEPDYHGKPISYWIEPWRHEGETEASVKAAYEEMDDRAVAWLIRQLKWKPSMLARWIDPYLFRWDIAFPDKPDRRDRAAIALSELGTRAASAIPVLEQLVFDSPTWDGTLSVVSARAALVRLRNEPVENLFRKLENSPKQTEEIVETFALILLPEHVEASVPFFARRLATENPENVRHRAAAALEEMASRPEECVPQLMACLGSSDSILQGLALKALAAFGTNASSAVSKISTMTNSTEPFVFRNATNALHRIQHGPPKIPFSWLKGLESH